MPDNSTANSQCNTLQVAKPKQLIPETKNVNKRGSYFQELLCNLSVNQDKIEQTIIKNSPVRNYNLALREKSEKTVKT